MLAFTINNTKQCMGHLLKGEAFDRFTFRQGEILALGSFTLNGAKDPEDLTEEDKEPFCLWGDIKPFVFQAVKGKKLPKSMKLVLSLSQEKTEAYPNAKAVFLNLLFRDGTLLCTTSVAQKNFSLEKQSEIQWEEHVLSFFKSLEIGVQIKS